MALGNIALFSFSSSITPEIDEICSREKSTHLYTPARAIAEKRSIPAYRVLSDDEKETRRALKEFGFAWA